MPQLLNKSLHYSKEAILNKSASEKHKFPSILPNLQLNKIEQMENSTIGVTINQISMKAKTLTLTASGQRNGIKVHPTLIHQLTKL